MQRIQHLDLARGFIVFIMPSVHVVMLYSQPAVHASILGDMLRFLAEGPGAQLFMFIMGASFVLSKSITAKKVFHRTILLAIGAFALNIFKFVIPMELELLPASFMIDFPLSEMKFVFMGDIFHFAAIAYPITYAISRWKQYAIAAALLAVGVMFLAPYIWNLKTGNNTIDQLMIYFIGGPPHAFFPVFPWLVYPLMGLALSKWLEARILSTIGFVLLVISLGLPATTEFTSHYRTRPTDTLFHVSIVLLWLSLFRFLQQKIRPNYFFRLLKFCSRHISDIYIIQWLLIFWLLSIAGYLELSLWPTLIWMYAITATTLALTYISKPHATRKNL